jgi:mono/diheme cytochrome c family protein
MKQRITQNALLGLLSLSLGLVAACDDVRSNLEIGIPAMGDKPFGELNPAREMHDQPALKAQEEEMLLNAPLTVSQQSRPFPETIKADRELAGQIGNPLSVDTDTMARGQDLYMTYCVVCHGERGLGNGYVIPKFTKPPSLTSRKLRGLPDGHIYHIITNGQNIMSSYKTQLTPMERWAVVHYIRALQRAEYPTKADAERYQKTTAQ